jgi:hypothetical protein
VREEHATMPPMTTKSMTTILFGAVLLLGGCATQRATELSLPRERATECRDNCAALDMQLAAVVIIMNSAGCVCQPKGQPAPGPAVSAGAAAVAGGAVITAAVAAAAKSHESSSASSGAGAATTP